MNVKQLILATLEAAGNLVEDNEETGIVTVTTPDGSVWDFTSPLCLNNWSQSHIHQNHKVHVGVDDGR